MELLVSTLNKEIKTLKDNDIRLQAIGDLKSLPKKCYDELQVAIDKTKNHKKTTLILALSYSAKWELLEAIKEVFNDTKSGKISTNEIDETLFSSYLATKDYPDPELMIRTSGEYRISNFLLWQLAYSELKFLDKFWPDFRKEDLFEAIIEFQSRERRFGKTSEQLASK
jgi:undecaprenyl diphosphate synthase